MFTFTAFALANPTLVLLITPVLAAAGRGVGPLVRGRGPSPLSVTGSVAASVRQGVCGCGPSPYRAEGNDVAELHIIVDPAGLFERGGPLFGFDRGRVSRQARHTRRAQRLYQALGVRGDNEYYTLGCLPDGRWALVGPEAQGERFAIEKSC